MKKPPLNEDQQITEGKIFAVLSYLSILCIIPLALKKENPFVLDHGKQGLVIFVAQVAVFIITIIFPWIFKLGMFVLGILSLVGIIEVLRGRYVKFPIISKIADQIVL